MVSAMLIDPATGKVERTHTIDFNNKSQADWLHRLCTFAFLNGKAVGLARAPIDKPKRMS